MPHPMLIAHRGASVTAPENTMPAFQLAAQMGADGIELDVMLSRDGKVVVMHDASVDRTTDGSGKVHEMDWEDLRRLDAGGKKDQVFKGTPIPLLAEVLAWAKDRLVVNIELANYFTLGDQLLPSVAELVNSMHIGGQIIFSSFYPWNVKRIKELVPDAQVAVLAFEGWKGGLQRSSLFKGFSPEGIHPHVNDLSPAYLMQEHEWGRQIRTWTVNNRQEMQVCVDLGVDGIITDDIPLARTVAGIS